MPITRHYRYGSMQKHYEEFTPGYQDPDEVLELVFYRDHILFLGRLNIKTRREVLFRERMPQYALLSWEIHGHTSWKTSCPKAVLEKCRLGTLEVPAPMEA